MTGDLVNSANYQCALILQSLNLLYFTKGLNRAAGVAKTPPDGKGLENAASMKKARLTTEPRLFTDCVAGGAKAARMRQAASRQIPKASWAGRSEMLNSTDSFSA
jgi:hypothetical protein